MSLALKQKKIGVLMGGISTEREISLRSGKNVSEALEKLGYNIKRIDITSRNCQEQLKGLEIAFNILHGEFGEDGGIQQVLEKLKIPYTGSGPKASANCMEKTICKKILAEKKLPTPAAEYPGGTQQIKMSVPLVVKAASQGSSIGVTIVHEQAQVKKIFEATLNKFGNTFLEKYISGAEVTVGVIEDQGQLLALPILELKPKNEFYDFEAKYTPGGTEFLLPAPLDPKITKTVQALAIQSFQALQCSGAARVDFVLENRQTPYILEINTVPGMTDQSDLPAEAKVLGISFEKLVEKILATAGLNKY